MIVNSFLTRIGIAAVLLGVLSITGCGKGKDPWEIVYPVKGQINFEGKPIEGAVLTLIPEDSKFPSSVRPTAISEPDGSFEVGTYKSGDGAPAGSYKVIALRYPVVGTKENPAPGPNDLPVKYSRPETTELKVQVDSAPTKLAPFELKY